MFQSQLMQGQRILVTGGGTGLGQAMAEQFLALGADIAICGRRKSVCDATAQAWRAKFPERRIDTFGVDIRIAQNVEEMVEALWESGGLTGLVNNAAGNFISPTESLSPRGFDAIANIVFDMLTLFFLFVAAGHNVSLGILFAGYGLPLILGKMAFLLPGGVGVIEGSMVALYDSLQVPNAVSVVVILGYRLFSFWLPTLLGFAAATYLSGKSSGTKGE